MTASNTNSNDVEGSANASPISSTTAPSSQNSSATNSRLLLSSSTSSEPSTSISKSQSLSTSSTVATSTSRSPTRKKLPIFLLLFFSFGTLAYIILFLGPGIQPGKLAVDTVSNRTRLFQAREQHLNLAASSIARPYEPVPASTWCIDGSLRHEQAKRRPMGLCYVRLPMAASTTLASVNRRIAFQFAHREGRSQNCIRHDGHVLGMYYYKRHDLSFLWTSVRDPSARALSRVVYGFSDEPSKLQNHSKIMGALQVADEHIGAVSSGRGGFQLQYTMLSIIDEWSAWNASDPTRIRDPKQVKKNVAKVINGYDFIAVVERLDESLVALQLLLGLSVTDILYISAKQNGSYDRRRNKGGRGKWKCVKLAAFNITEDLQDYFESTEWFAKNYGDYLLYVAANLNLDQTIMKLGVKRFAKALTEYRSVKQAAMAKCSSNAIFPCSADGTDQYEASRGNCYSEDEGCGHQSALTQ